MPRWWSSGTAWLDGLPGLVDAQCEVWGLQVDGVPLHGSNALVVPVRRGPRGDDALALRMTPPGDDLSALVEALRFWDGRGTVTLVDVDVPAGALLLERLDARRPLSSLPLDDAIPVLARTMLRLARPAPAHVPSTTQGPLEERATLVPAWHSAGAGRHATLAQFHAAAEAADLLSTTSSTLAADADLHAGQVLAGSREAWLVVDPVLVRGDIECDLARVLWSRIDEMADSREVLRHLRTVVDVAGLDEHRARAWVLYRAASYLLWCLEHGLTEDPRRCGRLLDAVVPR